LDEVHAAMLQVRLRWLPEFTLRRQEIAKKYAQGIQHALMRKLATPQETTAHVYHLYVIACEQRDALQKHLDSHGVQTHCHYPVPIHHQESCKDIRRDPQGINVSERHATSCLSLPCHPQMSDKDVDFVIDVVNQFKG